MDDAIARAWHQYERLEEERVVDDKKIVVTTQHPYFPLRALKARVTRKNFALRSTPLYYRNVFLAYFPLVSRTSAATSDISFADICICAGYSRLEDPLHFENALVN